AADPRPGGGEEAGGGPRQDAGSGQRPGPPAGPALPRPGGAVRRRPPQPAHGAAPPRAGTEPQEGERAEAITMNSVGKALVLINLVLSIVLMTWALILIVQPVDYAWKEPRKVWVTSPPEGKKERSERIASRIDERVAGHE